MRNLKKFLALVLAMVMAFSLMLSASAADADYDKYGDTDQITAGFETAVHVLTGLDVLKGDDDGFRPYSTLTRAEAAVIVYRVATGDVNDNQTAIYKDYATFKDMSHDDWFAGYVGFCQNAGYIKGTSPTTFSPYLPVTGYEMLAMLLRVIGYGQNNEFVGGAWQVNVASLAEKLHITDTVKEANFGSTLNQGARRDVVAELTFRTINDVPTVTYTPALGYSDKSNLLTSVTNDTQAYEIFKLVNWPVVQADSWGRPNDTWYCDRSAGTAYRYDKDIDAVAAVIKWDPVAEYNTAKTECDIIHENTDWSEDKDQAVTSRYVNGVATMATTYKTDGTVNTTNDLTPKGGVENEDNTIEALGTTNVIGAQGRVLEIYDMTKSYRYNAADPNRYVEDGARIVEIDTWLAKVDRVNAAGTDKNGHPTDATVDLSVYCGGNDGTVETPRTHDHTVASCPVGNDTIWDFDGVKAEGYSVGDYVLVYINCSKGQPSAAALQNKGVISNIRKAELKTGGYVNSWTNGSLDQPDTTTVGTTKYNDAAKFCANWRVQNLPWSVAVDDYGNAIGLVNPSQYLVIEAVRWIHDGTLYGGYALADVITAAGERVEGIKIADVNNRTVTNTTDQYGIVGSSTVSDYFTNNNQYYKHIFNYAVKEDGTYSLRGDVDAAVTGNTDFDNRTAWGYDGTRPAIGTPDTIATPANTSTNHYEAWNTTSVLNSPRDLIHATIARGEATIWGETSSTGTSANVNKLVATNSTVFAVLDGNSQTYTVYVGKDNVPSINDASLCALTDANGYAVFVVVSGVRQLADNKFEGFVGSISAPVNNLIAGANRNGYAVYKIGETTPTYVYDNNGYSVGTSCTNVGFYTFEVDQNGLLTAAPVEPQNYAGYAIKNNELNVAAAGVINSQNNSYLERLSVNAAPNGGSITAAAYNRTAGNAFVLAGENAVYPYVISGYQRNTAATATAFTDYKDFNIDNATIIKVTKSTLAPGLTAASTTNNATLSVGSTADLVEDSIIWVHFTDRQVNGRTVHDADTVYVLQIPYSAPILASLCTTHTTTNANWFYAVNSNQIAKAPSCAVANFNTTASQEAALKLAVEKATEIKMSEIINPTGSYTVAMAITGGTQVKLRTFNNAGSVTLSAVTGAVSGTAGSTYTSGLAKDNYIICAFQASGSTYIDHFQAYKIVD